MSKLAKVFRDAATGVDLHSRILGPRDPFFYQALGDACRVNGVDSRESEAFLSLYLDVNGRGPGSLATDDPAPLRALAFDFLGAIAESEGR